ncbi:hypothetical protein ACNKHM_04875 [Shigella sonnei]
MISIIHQSGLLQTLEVGENLITASHALLPGWTIRIGKYRMKLNYRKPDAGLSPTDRSSYHGRTPTGDTGSGRL